MCSPANTETEVFISQSDPEWDPGGVGGRVRDAADGRKDCRPATAAPAPLVPLVPLLELRRAARVTFLAVAADVSALVPAFRPMAPWTGEEIRLLLEDMKLLPDPPFVPWPEFAGRLNCIALDIGMHGKHSASMSIASVESGRVSTITREGDSGKKGGQVVISVCSADPDQNERQEDVNGRLVFTRVREWQGMALLRSRLRRQAVA